MTFHPKVLGSRQFQVLARLGPALSPHGFYLGGGTAVALHLGHRRSVDLDWFTGHPLEDPLWLAQELRRAGVPFVTDQIGPGTLHGAVLGVRVSLFAYRYPLLRSAHPWHRGKCKVASRPDLMAMKLAAIAQRGAKKDFVDLFALGQAPTPLSQMLEWYQLKYDVSDVAHVLFALAHFDDADRERMPRMIWNSDWRTVKRVIRDWVRALSR